MLLRLLEGPASRWCFPARPSFSREKKKQEKKRKKATFSLCSGHRNVLDISTDKGHPGNKVHEKTNDQRLFHPPRTVVADRSTLSACRSWPGKPRKLPSSNPPTHPPPQFYPGVARLFPLRISYKLFLVRVR